MFTFPVALYGVVEEPATYYISPGTGDDSNDGLSIATAWKNLPGTRNAGDSAYLNTNSVVTGDILEIKAGSAFTSTTGGKVDIDSTYYDEGTSGSPIYIRTSASWGAGDVTYNMSGVTIPDQEMAITITARDHIHINGRASSTFNITNVSAANNGGAIMTKGFTGNFNQGGSFKFIEVTDSLNAYNGIMVGRTNNFAVEDCLVDGCGYTGFTFGNNSDHANTDLTILRCQADNNGDGGSGGDLAHGFVTHLGQPATFTDCTADGNRRDGFDGGVVDNESDETCTIIYNRCVATANGEDGIASNGTEDGHGVFTTYVINCRAWGNGSAGYDFYQGITIYLYNCVSLYNNEGLRAYASTGFTIDVTVRNFISYKPTSYGFFGWHGDGIGSNTIDIDYSMWVPVSADTEDLYQFLPDIDTYAGTPSGSHITWGVNNLWGIAQDPDFDAVDDTVWTNNDLHLGASSDAEDAGEYLSSPASVLIDLDNVTRSDPPEIGVYERN